MFIKSIGPSRGSKFKQSYIKPESCKKLFESQRNQPIICRSSWERKFIGWLERNPRVVRWGSECICIPYTNPIDKKTHRYYPDFVVQTDSEIWIIEIKPYNQTVKPDKTNKWMMEQWVKNISKWTALKKICDDKGYKFMILTEKTINSII